MGFRESAIRLLGTVNATGFVLVSLALFFLDTGVTYFIIQKVPYTEIDWSTYMQQVECYLKKRQLNYSLIEGDTGPIVYPGGHLSVYSWLYSFTNGGKDIRTGQFIFMGLYMLNLLLVLRLYYKSNKIVPIVLPFLVITGYRIHSIFVLRLFNDPIAMFFFYLAANLFISQWWFFGCLFYSFAVSIKMNVLLFAPALFFVLLLNNGMWWTVVYLSVCAVIQLYMGLPFLIYDPVSYLKRSFDLGRVFFYEWTVNWRFLPEETFLDKRLHIALLLFHIVVLGIFGFHMWFRSHGGLKASLLELSHGIRTRTGVAETLFALFSANLIGIAFSRSLHYQFYSWYFHQLPFLLFWNSGDILTFKQLLFTFSKGGLLLLIEYSWNTFPSTPTSSLLLHFSHAVILLYLVFTRVERYKRKFKMITRLLCRPSTSLAGRCLSSGQKTTEEPKLDTLPAHLRVFDRKMKTAQRNWAVRQPDFEAAQYLKEEVGWRIADRVFDLTKFNKLALEIGCGVGHIAPHMIKENIGTLVQCDMSQFMVEKSKGAEDNEVVIERVHCDEEQLQPFEANQFDLLLSSLSAHWINDLPGWFRRCHELLKPNCPLIGAMLAADTLFELRCSLQLAEMERTGGVGSHISPFVQAQDVGGLLNKAGFDMITLDLDEIEVGFPNMFALLYDLQLMAESNCTIRRSPTIRKDVLVAAEAIYRAMYAKDDKFPATFKVLSFIGWKPGQNMPKPAKRGSQNVSLKDLSKIVENPELAESLSKNRKKE